MCGFVGYFKGRDRDFSCEINKAAESIRHRGPDMSGITTGELFGIAFNRLSINDLSPSGMQPFSFDGVVAYMNGEIYNHKEIKKTFPPEFKPHSSSDIELLPYLFRRFGINGLNQINGPFSGAIIDTLSDECFLVSDRFGVKPLYYTLRNEILYFASELKALAELLPLEADPLAISLAASCYGFPYPHTPFKGVERLEPGTCLRFKGREGVRQYPWYTPQITSHRLPAPEVRDEFMALFESAVKLRLECDVPVGGYISGGMDSTSILWQAHKLFQRDMHVFNSYVEDKTSFGNDTDNVNAARLAKDLGLHYHRIKLNWDVYDRKVVGAATMFDEIMFDNGTLIFSIIAEEARKYVTVMLDGVGGDELFGGYSSQYFGMRLGRRFFQAQGKLGGLYSSNVTKMLSHAPRGFMRLTNAYRALTNIPLWHIQGLSIIPLWLLGDRVEAIDDILSRLSRQRLESSMRFVPNDYGNALNACNIFSIIAFQNNEAERGAMAHSIEGRSPFLDYRLFELMMGVDSKAKIQGGQKALMREWFRGSLPAYITDAPKSGPALALTKWIADDPARMAAIDKLLTDNLDVIETLLGTVFAAAVKKKHKAIYGRGLMLHSLVAIVVWAKKNVQKKSYDPAMRLTEFAYNS